MRSASTKNIFGYPTLLRTQIQEIKFCKSPAKPSRLSATRACLCRRVSLEQAPAPSTLAAPGAILHRGDSRPSLDANRMFPDDGRMLSLRSRQVRLSMGFTYTLLEATRYDFPRGSRLTDTIFHRLPSSSTPSFLSPVSPAAPLHWEHLFPALGTMTRGCGSSRSRSMPV